MASRYLTSLRRDASCEQGASHQKLSDRLKHLIVSGPSYAQISWKSTETITEMPTEKNLNVVEDKLEEGRKISQLSVGLWFHKLTTYKWHVRHVTTPGKSLSLLYLVSVPFHNVIYTRVAGFDYNTKVQRSFNH